MGMLLQIFAMYDKNGDNSLSLAEVTEGIKETGVTAKYLMQADRDGDSRISKEEWLMLFSPIPDADVEATKQWLAGKREIVSCVEIVCSQHLLRCILPLHMQKRMQSRHERHHRQLR